MGLGGRWDATNVVPAPAVCGITSLGYDHMELLGYTLREIAGEKAGIMKPSVPCFTSPQEPEVRTRERHHIPATSPSGTCLSGIVSGYRNSAS